MVGQNAGLSLVKLRSDMGVSLSLRVRGDLYPYIFIGFRIIVRNGGPFLRGQRGTVD
jgi:hypothetical protein